MIFAWRMGIKVAPIGKGISTSITFLAMENGHLFLARFSGHCAAGKVGEI